jgi:sulfatase maturation enzyme AslB (radical SAM superfamily)
MITTACNFRCDYCFGAEMIGPGKTVRHMAWQTFVGLLDWIERADVPNLDVHLMGGEPTIHARFADMYRELRRRGRRVIVFSNASVPLAPEVLRESAELGVTWIVNVNTGDTYRPGEYDVLRRNLAVLGQQAVITFNVRNGHTAYQHVFDLIEEYRLARQLKLGVVLPTLGHENVFVWRPDFGAVSRRVMEIFEQACAGGIEVEFECGVPYCLFTPEQRQRLKGILISSCGSRLDITPDGEVINCLPLCKVAAVPYTRFKDYAEACRWFRKALGPYRAIGADSECPGCEHLEQGRCWVCLAHGMGDLNRIALPAPPNY